MGLPCVGKLGKTAALFGIPQQAIIEDDFTAATWALKCLFGLSHGQRLDFGMRSEPTV